MSEPRLDRSDAQIARHASGQLAELAGVMRQCLIEQAFLGVQLDRMLEIWWEVTIKNSFAPDLAGIMNDFLQSQKGDEE